MDIGRVSEVRTTSTNNYHIIETTARAFGYITDVRDMDVGVLTVALKEESFADVLAYLSELGVDAIEIGCGGNPGSDHLDRERLLDNADHRATYRERVEDAGLYISALAVHNNPLHPDDDHAEHADRQLREAIELAGALDVGCITCFSGLPGGGPRDEVPNWITAPWPPIHAEALEYQWEQAIPYWTAIGEHADAYDVDVAIEMHPNMLVYEPTGLLALRDATHPRIGANLDPSHLFWQGIEIATAIRDLGEADAIHHVHAKDTKLYAPNKRKKGVLDTTAYTDEVNRSWIFRSIGYGHGETFWKDFVSTLRMVGYDGALSIEHEDSLTTPREGLEKGVDVLQRAVLETTPGEAHWTE